MFRLAIWIVRVDGVPVFANAMAGQLPRGAERAIAETDHNGVHLLPDGVEFLVLRNDDYSVCVASTQMEINERSAKALYSLSAAEARVARVLASGQTPRAVGDALGASVHTIRTHLKNLFAKTGASGQNALVARLNAGIAGLRLPCREFTQLGDYSK